MTHDTSAGVPRHQSSYRILFQRDINCICLQIAVAETEHAIETAWIWLQSNMMPFIEMVDPKVGKESWVTSIISDMVATLDSGTDELSSDEGVRNASRTFRQLFNVPSSERLVTYYSCAYNGRQGWMYISENYLGFYSFLLGIEAKTLIELKEIEDITKDKTKRSMLGDSLTVITKDKRE
ncbi:hypothetical protein BDF14DRAFT_1110238 [Spinellus fusiger]|nr:hypothetical protein BDF14DRAFT_1110238 [Spinellus fusiger]